MSSTWLISSKPTMFHTENAVKIICKTHGLAFDLGSDTYWPHICGLVPSEQHETCSMPQVYIDQGDPRDLEYSHVGAYLFLAGRIALTDVYPGAARIAILQLYATTGTLDMRNFSAAMVRVKFMPQSHSHTAINLCQLRRLAVLTGRTSQLSSFFE